VTREPQTMLHTSGEIAVEFMGRLYYKDEQPTRRAWILRPLRSEPTEDHAPLWGLAICFRLKEA
jgi:hypothetical protein